MTTTEQILRDAVEKFIKAKGRFHTEQNYAALVKAFDATAQQSPAWSPDRQSWAQMGAKTADMLVIDSHYAIKRIEREMAGSKRGVDGAMGAGPRQIPNAECAQSKCACVTTGCWGECQMRRNPVLFASVERPPDTTIKDGALVFDEALPERACWCQTCRPITMEDCRMVLCPTCGNKRCPRATHHENACTGSNEPGQPGSNYPAPKSAEQALRERQAAYGAECMELGRQMAKGAK
jgi:hypothetical protein